MNLGLIFFEIVFEYLMINFSKNIKNKIILLNLKQVFIQTKQNKKKLMINKNI